MTNKYSEAWKKKLNTNTSLLNTNWSAFIVFEGGKRTIQNLFHILHKFYELLNCFSCQLRIHSSHTYTHPFLLNVSSIPNCSSRVCCITFPSFHNFKDNRNQPVSFYLVKRMRAVSLIFLFIAMNRM